MRKDEQSQQVFNEKMEEEVYIIQHSDGLSNSTGTNELDEVISRSRIAQVMPTYFKLIPFNIRNCSSIEHFCNSEYQR